MSISEYTSELEKTKTYRDGLIAFREYKIETKWAGLRTVFPELPCADSENHIVVMDFKGGRHNIFSVLTKKEYGINLNTNNLSHFLFIFVKIKPRNLHISSPQKGYQLGDGHRVDAIVNIVYRIEDVESFWMVSDDPLATLEFSIIDEVKNYFLGITSEYLIRRPSESKNDLERHIYEHKVADSEIKRIKIKLEDQIKDKYHSNNSGVKIESIYAEIQLSETLSEHLNRLHDRIYSKNGILEKSYSLQGESLQRKQIDQQIDNDTTFAPYNLRNIIMVLDTGLLENFYNISWSLAMQKVHDELKRQKNSYLSDQRRAKIDGIRELLQIAREEEFDQIEIEKLKDKLIVEMSKDHAESGKLFTDRQFLELAVGTAAPKISSDENKKKNEDS